jgi:Ca2+-binding RTX toxin-like protein
MSKIIITVLVLLAGSVLSSSTFARANKGLSTVIDTTKYKNADKIEFRTDKSTKIVIISKDDRVQTAEGGFTIIRNGDSQLKSAGKGSMPPNPPIPPVPNICNCNEYVVLFPGIVDIEIKADEKDINKCLIIYGNDEDNKIFGNNRPSELHGADGNDQFFGGVCSDIIFGEGGEDVIVGGEGADTVYSADGDVFSDKNSAQGDKYIESEHEL